MNVGIAGFRIESCTFSPLISNAEDFHVQRGEELLSNYPFLSKYDEVKFTPLVSARATPGGPVSAYFYAQIKDEVLTALQEQGPWDGLFLHMHGAMFVKGMEDVEGDFISAIRQAAGPDCVIAASYDLHGNLSQRVVDNLDLLTAYRTAPLVDWYQTLERACELLVNSLNTGKKPAKSVIPVPILLSGEQTSTEWHPADALYSQIPQIIEEFNLLDASILIGYVWADEPRATASVLALEEEDIAARQASRHLAKKFWDLRHEFSYGETTETSDECIRSAMASSEHPVVISDSGDNPTAGGAGDVPYVFERLIALNVSDALYASMPDPAAVELCFEAGIEAKVNLSLDGKLDPVYGSPLEVQGKVITLTTQPWSLSAAAEEPVLNKIAVVLVNGIRVIITEQRIPFHKRNDFLVLGIHPEEHQMIVVKIGYLVPELKALAARSLLALSPGAVDQAITDLPYKRLNRPLFPFDANMEWHPEIPDSRS